jgi:hypothetical protein
MKHWLTTELKGEIRKVFEPRYKKKLSDLEIIDIANNLVGGMESIIRLKQKDYYGK